MKKTERPPKTAPLPPPADQPLLPWLSGKRPLRIAVIGDIMLDEYLDGAVNRISPEAPVPIHQVKSSYVTAGGAANVARNIQLAGGQALLFGVCGDDQAAKDLKAILAADGISTDFLICSQGRPTTKKTRITSTHHQLMRIDWEERAAIDQPLQDQLVKAMNHQELDAILISDYAKGTLTESLLKGLFTLAEKKGIPTLVDPKGTDFSKYRGATLITPNLKEALDALGGRVASETPPQGENLARQLQEIYLLNDILVTMGPRGMVYVPSNRELPSIYQPTVAKDVFDVTGAGDTVIAMMALAIAAKTKISDAVKIANVAAGIVVEKWGCKPVTQDELILALNHKDRSHSPKTASVSKIIARQDVPNLINKLKRSDKSIVFTNGCFDLLHAGHISYLENSSSLGDILIIGINDDESVRRLKGPTRPIIKLADRARLLASLNCVDYVIAFEEDTPKSLIELVQPNFLVKGADWDIDKIVGADVVMQSGGEVKRIPLVEGLSTSELIRRIQKNESALKKLNT